MKSYQKNNNRNEAVRFRRTKKNQTSQEKNEYKLMPTPMSNKKMCLTKEKIKCLILTESSRMKMWLLN